VGRNQGDVAPQTATTEMEILLLFYPLIFQRDKKILGT
jgi:hypothetical protein